VTLQPHGERGSELKEGRAGGKPAVAGDSKGLAGFAPPLRPSGQIGIRNAPVHKHGEVSPLTFPIIATGDRQLAADTGRRPGPVSGTPGARTAGGRPTTGTRSPAGGKFRTRPSENWPTDAGRGRRRGVAEDTPRLPYF